MSSGTRQLSRRGGSHRKLNRVAAREFRWTRTPKLPDAGTSAIKGRCRGGLGCMIEGGRRRWPGIAAWSSAVAQALVRHAAAHAVRRRSGGLRTSDTQPKRGDLHAASGHVEENRQRQRLHRGAGPERWLHAQGTQGLRHRRRCMVDRRRDVRPDSPDALAHHHLARLHG